MSENVIYILIGIMVILFLGGLCWLMADEVKVERKMRKYDKTFKGEEVLHKNEEAFLKAFVDRNTTYIVRNGASPYQLWVCIGPKPMKNYETDTWCGFTNDNLYFSIDSSLFPFIKWEDAEPRSVEELLKLKVVDKED